MQALTAAHKLNIFQLEAQAKALGKAGPLWLKQQELLHGIAPLQLQHAQLMDKQATAQKALSLIQQKYGGMMAKFSHNNAGQMSNLRNSIDVLAASMGTALLPALKIVVGGLITFAQWGQKHKTLLLALIGTVAAVTVVYGAVTVAALWATALEASGPIMIALGPIIAGVRTAVMILGLSFEAMGLEATVAWAAATLGVTLVIAGVVAGVALIVTHFGTFKRIVGGVWKWFTGAVGTAADALKGVFESPIKWLINAIKWIVDKVLWLPRELAKLNPFGGNDAATRHTIAKGGANPSVTGRFGPVGPFRAPGLTTSHATSGNSLNTVHPTGHMQTNATGDVVIHVHSHIGGKIVASEVTRQSLRAVALG